MFISKLKLFFFKFINKFFTNESVYYINGPSVLPPPLESEKEAEYARLSAAGDTEARDILIVHNLRLVVYIARKFEAASANIEDLISIGTIGLMKAVKTFKADKNIKLATYASRCIENEILMYLRKTNSLKTELSFDEPLNVDWDGNELLLSDVLGSEPDVVNHNVELQDERRIVASLVDKLPERERKIMQMRFGFYGYEEHTQKQVADILGISQSYISRLEKKIIAKLKKEVEKVV
ncbi:MAG: RNA polymerase sporulation sigma factor SigE [Acutalibacteraceae bacterium]